MSTSNSAVYNIVIKISEVSDHEAESLSTAMIDNGFDARKKTSEQISSHSAPTAEYVFVSKDEKINSESLKNDVSDIIEFFIGKKLDVNVEKKLTMTLS